MALADLKIFEQQTYTAYQELLDYNVNLFNEATQGGLVLTSGSMLGSFSTEAFWARIAAGTVKRRNVFGTGTLANQALSMKERSKVKVAAGSFPIDISPSMFTWIQKAPEEAAAVFGRQLAQDTMNDMVNVAMSSLKVALGAQTTNKYDGTAGTCSLDGLLTASQLYGDRASEIVCWLMHSKPNFDLFHGALANDAKLFTFGSVKVMQDGFGRPFIIADHPSLYTAAESPAVTTYHVLGLTAGAAVVEQNPDFLGNISTINGNENIARTYQAEWTYNLSLKGFSWDKANGGASPTDAALATATNWDKVALSYRDLGGVLAEFK